MHSPVLEQARGCAPSPAAVAHTASVLFVPTPPLPLSLLTRYDPGDGTNFSPYKRNLSNVLFRAQSLDGGLPAPWAAASEIYPPDRQVAWGQYYNVTQGVYVCANGGNCTAPDLCHCAPGYIGFDCRYGHCFGKGWGCK